MATLPTDDEIVDLQSENHDQDDQEEKPLIPSSSSCSSKKWIAAAIVMVIFISGIILLTVCLSTNSISPIRPTDRPAPPHVPTIRPLPKNATNMTAESLLYLVFGKSQLEYTDILCFPQIPRTFKIILQVAGFSNYTAESNTKIHARMSVSRQAAEKMFGLDYSHQAPIPPAPLPCQIISK